MTLLHKQECSAGVSLPNIEIGVWSRFGFAEGGMAKLLIADCSESMRDIAGIDVKEANTDCVKMMRSVEVEREWVGMANSEWMKQTGKLERGKRRRRRRNK